ncbi:hypothetical protein P389DRAFT_14880 [Cystobasidium minutum MCA 4210]|uniref:uncharacterized protein n=1 Tax=Cystobasidium minutum MCA 4210 TaxID=1397322 RepID=UPI0034CF3C4F|eukprot:jgi/Rhomi1/14880/CE14879_598
MAEDIPFSCLYFGYGNNMSLRTLKQRFPDSAPAGLARLNDYKWMINEIGFANIVPSPGDVVYGSIAFLSSRDEAALDNSEGVPHHYEKRDVTVTRIDGQGKEMLRSDGSTQSVTAMTHIDVQRSGTGKGENDYLFWINRAISDASKEGLPQAYVEKYMRPFVPAKEETEEDQLTNMVRLSYDVKAPTDKINWSVYGAGSSTKSSSVQQ